MTARLVLLLAGSDVLDGLYHWWWWWLQVDSFGVEVPPPDREVVVAVSSFHERRYSRELA